MPTPLRQWRSPVPGSTVGRVGAGAGRTRLFGFPRGSHTQASGKNLKSLLCLQQQSVVPGWLSASFCLPYGQSPVILLLSGHVDFCESPAALLCTLGSPPEEPGRARWASPTPGMAGPFVRGGSHSRCGLPAGQSGKQWGPRVSR